MEGMVLEVAMAIITLWLGSTEWRLRTMDQRMRNAPSREEMEKMIEIKQEAIKAIQESIKEDIRELNKKIDTLIQLELSRKGKD